MDELDRLRRGLPESDSTPDGFPDTPEGRCARLYKAMGYSDATVQKILDGVDPWMILHNEPIADGMEFTLDGCDEAPAQDASPTFEIDETVYEAPSVEILKPGAISIKMPSDPVPAVTPVEPIPEHLSESHQNIARRLLPDSELSDLEYRIRYNRDRNARPILPSTKQDYSNEGFGGGTI